MGVSSGESNKPGGVISGLDDVILYRTVENKFLLALTDCPRYGVFGNGEMETGCPSSFSNFSRKALLASMLCCNCSRKSRISFNNAISKSLSRLRFSSFNNFASKKDKSDKFQK